MRFLLLFFVLVNTYAFAQDEAFNWGGDVRVKWKNSKKLGELRYESNLQAKYTHNNSWCDALLRVYVDENSAKQPQANMEIERALVGYGLPLPDNSTIYFEAGRAKLDCLFHSKLQYKSDFTGLHIGYTLDNFHLHGGVSNIQPTRLNVQTLDHYVYMAEARYALDSLPFEWTYSVTNWNPEFSYVVSQLSGTWHAGHIRRKPLLVYGALLKNHHYKNDSTGYYVGCTFDQVKEKNDYSIDVCYLYSDKDCVPSFDESHTGHRVIVKGIYSITQNLAMHAKITFEEDTTADISAVFTW